MSKPAHSMGKKSFAFHCPAEVSAVAKHVYLLFECQAKSQKQVGLTYFHVKADKRTYQFYVSVVFPGEVCFIPDAQISLHVQDFGAFNAPQVETSGSTKSGAHTVHFERFLWNDSFTCQLFFLFSWACFSCHASICSLNVNLQEQNIRQGHPFQFCQPALAYSNITPTVSRHSTSTYRKLIFLKESSLFLLSPPVDLNRNQLTIHCYLISAKMHIISVIFAWCR